MSKKIETKALMDEFFSLMDPERAKRNRKHIDRKEVYEYEKKINKQLIEMNPDELIEMIRTFSKANGGSIAYASYKQISSMYRSLFDYYIDNYEIIKNPWYKKELKGGAAYKKLKEGDEPLTWAQVEEVLESIYEEYKIGYYVPMYVELLCLLFYHGFATTKEIISMKREMVDFDNYVVNLPNKQIQISKRCVRLLEYFYDKKTIDGYRGRYHVVSWQGSYIKFFVREKRVANFDKTDIKEVCAIIVRSMTTQLRQKHKVDLNYRKLYNLGFYDFLCNKFGKKLTNEIIENVGSRGHNKMLYQAAEEYGINNLDTALIKVDLLPYVVK